MNPLRDAFAQFPYPNSPRAATSPDRLAAVARLFAVAAPDPASARVLEIGCSDGGNLLSLALTAPQGQFLGIDFSEPAIVQGQARIRELQLQNIELKVADLGDFPTEAGTFDYIIAHGVYSWVAPPLQDRLLALIERHLAPDGVAYVDYNAQPGSQIRFAFRESLLYHVRRFSTPQQRIDQARSFMKLIAEASPDPSPRRSIAEAEWQRLIRAPDTAIFHDLIALENHPCYFHEFAGAAACHRLEYLAEADVFEMSDATLKPSIREHFGSLRDIVEKEQYLDIVKGRVFRQTLLCHAGRDIARQPDRSALPALYFSAWVEVTPVTDSGEVSYRYEFGTLKTANALLKAIIDQLAAVFPARLSGEELAAHLRELHPSLAEKIETEFPAALLYATMSGVVTIHARPGQFTTERSPKPLASPLARLQAQRGEDIFTLNLKTLPNPDGKLRQLLPLLDGSHTWAELARSLGCQEPELEGYLREAAAHALLQG